MLNIMKGNSIHETKYFPDEFVHVKIEIPVAISCYG